MNSNNNSTTGTTGNPRFSLFLRAIGVKPGFRRGTGGPGLFGIALAALVGAVSGHYIFHEPLRAYWMEQQQKQQQQLQQQQRGEEGAKAGTGGAAAATSGEGSAAATANPPK
jgi:hypothetical protein